MLLLGVGQKARRSASLAPGKRLGESRFLYAYGFAAQTLAHMLDSLVRVSRRVGGAADLLTTERLAVPVRHSLYEPALCLPAAEPGTRGWGTSPQLHPRPRSTASSSSCEEQEKCSNLKGRREPNVFTDQVGPERPAKNLNLLLRLRARLRLPLHSFTYS